MPRNDVQPMLPPRPRDGSSTVGGEGRIANVPYVRLTQREPPRRNRRGMVGLFVAVLAGHALLVVWLLWGSPEHQRAATGAIEVSFLGAESNPPPPPPLAPPPPPLQAPAARPPVRLPHRVPRAPGSITATMDETPQQKLDLYNREGEAALPQGGPPTPVPAYRAPPAEGSSVLTIKTPLKYKPTHFAKGFEAEGRSEGAKLFDKMVDKTTVSKTMRTPTGDRITCSVSPLLILVGGLGCHGNIPPPPKNDDDIRLSMPPAETLTGKKVVVPASASSVAPRASGPGR